MVLEVKLTKGKKMINNDIVGEDKKRIKKEINN